jgi:tripartite-type tricarboxylate transporter receptor subunit TctC
MKNLVCFALAAISIMLIPLSAAAQGEAYPRKPVRLLIGYAAASGADVVARLLADKLQETFTQGVVVENKPGAGGILAAQEVARAAPDGYTLMLAAMPQIAILPAISKVPYIVDRDFSPVSQLVGTDLVLVTNPQRVPSGSMSEFVAWAKKQPTLFFGTPGPGTVGHFGSYLAAESINVKIEPIHFRTTGDQMAGMLNGDINAQFFSYAAALPLVKSGRLKALMTTSPARSSMFPDAPTPNEAGYPDLQFTSWYGIFAPANTPAAVLDKLNSEVVNVMRSPEARAKFENAGLRVTGTTRVEFAQLIKDDVARWSQVVKKSGFKLQE